MAQRDPAIQDAAARQKRLDGGVLGNVAPTTRPGCMERHLAKVREEEEEEENKKCVRSLPPLLLGRGEFLTNERPGIEDCVPYCGKVALITRADGNCRFSAELYSALAVAVQEPDRFISFWGKLAAVRTTSPYGTLGPVEKDHVEAFLGFAKSLGLWWKGYPGCHKEWLGPWLAAEALSVLTNEEEVTRSAARLDAKLAGAVDANTARRARTRFTQTVKTARYDSLHKGAVLVARICSMLGCNGDGREANVDETRRVGEFFAFSAEYWLPGQSLSVPIRFLNERLIEREGRILLADVTSPDVTNGVDVDKTVSVFKRMGLHFDILVASDSRLGEMLTARHEIKHPPNWDPYVRVLREMARVDKEADGDAEFAARLAAELNDDVEHCAEREEELLASFARGHERRSTPPGDTGGSGRIEREAAETKAGGSTKKGGGGRGRGQGQGRRAKRRK